MAPDNAYEVAALYKFFRLHDMESFRREIYAFTAVHAPTICGTLLLSQEGINGTIAARSRHLEKVISFLDERIGLKQGDVACELKYSNAERKPFNRFLVKLRKELITLRKPEADPVEQVGTYVDPEGWNDLISDPEVLLLDSRNDYETKMGTFEGAVDPNMHVFTELPEWIENNLDPRKHKKVAMYCTGGIRCEKASSYMLKQGFEEVYHLKGGILKYLETIPTEKSKWKGYCFVFDQRVSVGHGLKEGEWKLCHACQKVLSPIDCERKEYEHGISCHHCIDRLTSESKKALEERQKYYNERSCESHNQAKLI